MGVFLVDRVMGLDFDPLDLPSVAWACVVSFEKSHPRYVHQLCASDPVILVAPSQKGEVNFYSIFVTRVC